MSHNPETNMWYQKINKQESMYCSSKWLSAYMYWLLSVNANGYLVSKVLPHKEKHKLCAWFDNGSGIKWRESKGGRIKHSERMRMSARALMLKLVPGVACCPYTISKHIRCKYSLWCIFYIVEQVEVPLYECCEYKE